MSPRPLAPPPRLGALTPETFLELHWQREPLLVRGAFPDFRSPLSPDELAGLACEEDALARIVLEDAGARPWEVREGPFDADVFASLPERGWSLLVQEADRYVSELTDLLDRFRFVPDWRIDDLMVSYAPEGGSVGAHVDSYDVFLVQARGRRRWEWGPVDDPALVPDLDLRILQRFEPTESAILEPGDMLYLPPGVGHHGVALEACMTFSVGFLAPTRGELVADFVEETVSGAWGEERFADPARTVPDHPARLEEADLRKVRAMVRALPLDDEAIDEWFARSITTSRRSHPLIPPEEPPVLGELRAALAGGRLLRRAEGCRVAYRERPESLRLYVEGEAIELPRAALPLVERLTGRRELLEEDLPEEFLTPAGQNLIVELVARGALYLA